MPDKITDLSDRINRGDVELILEVNRKAIEIETEVAGQNEEIIELLSKIDSKQEETVEKTDKLLEKSEQLSRDLFKTQVLLVTGLIGLIAQIIQIFYHK
ncbi:MAG TPA: hypothetical protein VEP90_30685 [Methylomirabilota bacterium]|nr:hypothetical protein [Methylomirabilota bacterium]